MGKPVGAQGKPVGAHGKTSRGPWPAPLKETRTAVLVLSALASPGKLRAEIGARRRGRLLDDNTDAVADFWLGGGQRRVLEVTREER